MPPLWGVGSFRCPACTSAKSIGSTFAVPTVRLFMRPGLTRHHGSHFLGFIHFCLGYPDQALAYHTAAMAEARSELHQPSVAQSLGMKVLLLSLLGEAGSLAEHAEQLFTIGVDQGFPIWRARGLIFQGWAKIATGVFDDGICSLRAGVVAYEATGALWWMPHFYALQAEAEVIAGCPDAALSILIED